MTKSTSHILVEEYLTSENVVSNLIIVKYCPLNIHENEYFQKKIIQFILNLNSITIYYSYISY